MRTRKKQTAMRISDIADKLLDDLSEHLGMNRTAVIEHAIRQLAKSENIPIPAPQPGRKDCQLCPA